MSEKILVLSDQALVDALSKPERSFLFEHLVVVYEKSLVWKESDAFVLEYAAPYMLLSDKEGNTYKARACRYVPSADVPCNEHPPQRVIDTFMERVKHMKHLHEWDTGWENILKDPTLSVPERLKRLLGLAGKEPA